MPKVLTCAKGKFPLANWTSVAKGQRNNDGHDIPQAPPSINNHDTERNSSVMAPINRQQIYLTVLPPSKSRKELVNWKWASLGNPRPKINNINIAEQRHWQRCNGNNDHGTLDRQGDTAESESVEGDQMHLEMSEDRPEKSLEDLE